MQRSIAAVTTTSTGADAGTMKAAQSADAIPLSVCHTATAYVFG
jgi:hypothetical protein